MLIGSRNAMTSITRAANAADSTEPHRYEEFIGDSDECPTCRGLGRIRRDDDHLVALIPVSDRRLKPSKTWLAVIIAIIVSLLIGGLLLFFFISRSVTVDSKIKTIRPYNISLEQFSQSDSTSQILILNFSLPMNISNGNYLPITITSLQVSSLLYGDQLLSMTSNDSRISVPLRSTVTHRLDVGLVLQKPEYQSIITVCQSNSPILNRLWLNFQVTAGVSYLTHTESSSVTLYNRKVCCHEPTPNIVDSCITSY